MPRRSALTRQATAATPTTDLTVSKTIFQQLGGNRFAAMTGARDFVGDANSLSFRLSSTLTRPRVSGMTITLKDNDTYEMKTFRIRKLEVPTADTRQDVHAEDLQRVFTAMTGLDTLI